MASMTAVQDVPETDKQLRLEVTRLIKAPRARVFDAWTRPEMIRMWFGPEGMRPAEVSTDPRVGGAYTIGLESCADGTKQNPVATGTYTKVNPYDLLQFSWVGSWVPEEESLVTIHFRDVGDATEIRLIHDRFNTVESRDGHNKGWIACMDRLAERIDAVLAA